MAHRNKWKSKKSNDASRAKVPDYSPQIGAVDLANKDLEILLVKMPVYLSDQFEDPSRGVVGRLRMPKQGARAPDGGAANAQLCIDKPLQTNSGTRKISSQVPTGLQPLGRSGGGGSGGSGGPLVSTEYDISFLQERPGIYVFSSNAATETDAMRVEGTVSRKCQARPKLDERYNQLSKTRTQLSNTSGRGMERLDESERKKYERQSIKVTDMGETARQREERKKQKESARSHLDVPDEKWRDAVRADVVRAFETQAYYTADELARSIGERTTRIRPVISELCAYNKSGPFSGKYELKDEYKTDAQRTQKQRELEAHREAQMEMARKRKEERMEREKQDGPQSKKQRTL